MNTYIILAALCSGLGILFMFLATSKGRKIALAETEKNLVSAFDNLDRAGRTKFIKNANLNNDEIILQINNQTSSSAAEIIEEVQDEFGLIEKYLSQYSE